VDTVILGIIPFSLLCALLPGAVRRRKPGDTCLSATDETRRLPADFASALGISASTGNPTLVYLTRQVDKWFSDRAELTDQALRGTQRELCVALLQDAQARLLKGESALMVEQIVMCKAHDLFDYVPRLVRSQLVETDSHDYVRCACCGRVVDKQAPEASISRGQYLCHSCRIKWDSGELVRCAYSACSRIIAKSTAVRSKGGLYFSSNRCMSEWNEWE
jgi:hypothetical protein